MTAPVIDVTDLVENMRSAFVDYGVAYVFGLEVAIPGMEWVSLPIISTVDKEVIREILNLVSKATIMQAFFLNTALRKASQAGDLIAAVKTKLSLPQGASDADYEKAERAQMLAFRNFVLLVN